MKNHESDLSILKFPTSDLSITFTLGTSFALFEEKFH